MIRILAAAAALAGSVVFAQACPAMKSVEADTNITVASIEPAPVPMSTPQTAVPPADVKLPADATAK